MFLAAMVWWKVALCVGVEESGMLFILSHVECFLMTFR